MFKRYDIGFMLGAESTVISQLVLGTTVSVVRIIIATVAITAICAFGKHISLKWFSE